MVGWQEELVAFVDRLWNLAEVSRRRKAIERPAERAVAQAPEEGSGSRAALVLLSLALALGLLRFWRLSAWSLWIDESLTWTDWHVGLEGGEIQNPFGYALVALGVKLAGGTPDEFGLRILPAIAGYLTIPAAYFAFRPWTGSLRAAAAALLLAVSSWSIYWAQNARFYTFAQLVALVGVGLFLRGLVRGSPWRAILGLVVVAFGALFHPSIAVLLPALIAAPFVLDVLKCPLAPVSRRAARWVLYAALLGGLVGATWAWRTWRTYSLQKGMPFDVGEIAASIAHYSKTTGFFVTPLLGVGALCGAWFAWRRRESEQVFVAVVVALTLTCALLAAVFVRVSAQYVFFLLPWVALLACAPLARIERRDPEDRIALRGGAGLAYLSLLFVPALVTTALYFTVRRGERPQWREAYDYVWNHRGADDLVLGMDATVGEYYLAPRETDLRHPQRIGWIDYYRARDPETWSRHGRRAWYLVNPEEFYDWKPEDAANFQRMLREECRLVTCYPLYVESRDLSVWVYARD
jgi:hypothetical protein